MSNKIVASGGTSNAGSRSRDAAYAEFMIPIIGEDNRISGIHSLGVQAAWRVEQLQRLRLRRQPEGGREILAGLSVCCCAPLTRRRSGHPPCNSCTWARASRMTFLMDPARGDDGMQYKTKSLVATIGSSTRSRLTVSPSGLSWTSPCRRTWSLSVSVNWSQIELEDQDHQRGRPVHAQQREISSAARSFVMSRRTLTRRC